MASPNSDVAKNVGQGKTTPDMTQEYDKRHGTYDGSKSEGGKPTNAGPGTLPNTPSPFTTTGG